VRRKHTTGSPNTSSQRRPRRPNGGPRFSFTPAISLYVSCETQAEVDEPWEKLSAGGSTERCGWLKDRYGLSWQIIPAALGKLLADKDADRSQRSKYGSYRKPERAASAYAEL
jgi:predicted 3-demethylubiquinone-9 3-methyltransferase (glyoxalase superfamily)